MPIIKTCVHGIRPQNKCKKCASEYHKEYYRLHGRTEEQKALDNAYAREYYRNQLATNPVRMRFQSILINARRRKHCNIAIDDLLGLWEQQHSCCAYCGTEMTYERGGRKPTSVSIDRVDPAGYYTISNIVLACWACNSGKGEMTAEEYIAHCRQVAQYQKN
jgi:hypothetical protein